MKENTITREEIVAALPAYDRKVTTGATVKVIISFISLALVFAVFVYLKVFNTQFSVREDYYCEGRYVLEVEKTTAWILRCPAEYQGKEIKEVWDIGSSTCPDVRFVYMEDGIEEYQESYGMTWETKIIAIRLPDTIKYIAPHAFENWSSLKKVYWDVAPENTVIGACAFAGSGLREFTIPEGVTYVGWKCFYKCKKLEKVTMPDSVTKAGVGTFAYCKSLEEVQLSENIDLIPDFMFSECTNLKTVEMGDNIRAIGHYAFYDTLVTQEQFPDNLYYYTTYHSDDKQGGIHTEDILRDYDPHFTPSLHSEYETVYYDKVKEKQFFAEKYGAPLEVFDEPADSDRIWIEGKYYQLPLKTEDFLENAEWEAEEIADSDFIRLKHAKTGHIMYLALNRENGKEDSLYVMHEEAYCSIVLPGGIPMGDSLAHYYCLEKYSSRFKDEFVSGYESFFIGTEDNPIECYYNINRFGYWYDAHFYLVFTDKDNAGSDDSD